MTRKERNAVVELLRCAADVCSLTRAGVTPLVGTVAWLAWEAKRDVQSKHQRNDQFIVGDEEYRWMLLEAAARVEEGSYP